MKERVFCLFFLFLIGCSSVTANTVADGQALTRKAAFIILISVTEWSGELVGAPFSRDIGPAIRAGIKTGQTRRASEPVKFKVEWFGANLAGRPVIINDDLITLPGEFPDGSSIEIIAKNGLATIGVDPDVVTAETVIRVWPETMRMASPPDGLPLETTPGELKAQVDRSLRGTYLHFVLGRP